MPLPIPARLLPFLNRPPVWWLAVFGWAAFLFAYCTFISSPSNGPEIPHIDKLFHFTYYAPGAACAAIALALDRNAFTTRVTVTTILLFTLLGTLDEFYQSFYPHRSGNDLGDLTADVLGAITGTLVAKKIFPSLKPKRPSPSNAP